MNNLTLVPIPPEQLEVINLNKARTLQQEIVTLRGALKLVSDLIHSKEDATDIPFLAATLSRISDSIVRALLAELRLYRANNDIAEARAEIQRVFKIIGWPDQS